MSTQRLPLLLIASAALGVGNCKDGSSSPYTLDARCSPAAVDAGLEGPAADRTVCDPDMPHAAFVFGRMSGSRTYAFNRGDYPEANDVVTLLDIQLVVSDPGTGTTGDVVASRLLSETGEILFERREGDSLRCSKCPLGQRKAPFDTMIRVLPGGAFLEMVDTRYDKVLVHFDMRGHLQLLCMAQPCLRLCQPAEADARGADGGDSEMGATAARDAFP